MATDGREAVGRSGPAHGDHRSVVPSGSDIQLFQIAVPERLGLDMITVGDQQNLVTARRQAAQEAANRIHQETERFVADCVASLREQTAALCDEMLESIRTSETGVHQKT